MSRNEVESTDYEQLPRDDSMTDDGEDDGDQLTHLTEENERPRRKSEQSQARGKRRQWRKIALAVLLLASINMLVAAFLYPANQTVLLALGGTGLFLGLLVVAMRPERDGLDESVFRVVGQNNAGIVRELDLEDVHVYVPSADTSAHLFVPRQAGFEVPHGDDRPVTIDTDPGFRGGLTLYPTGSALLVRFEEIHPSPIPEEPEELARHLCEALEDGFEIAETAHPDVDASSGRATVTLAGTAFGPVDQFDHPVRSFLGVGLAVGLGIPVSVESVTETGEDSEFEVRYTWDTE
jgi:hypothetical protein